MTPRVAALGHKTKARRRGIERIKMKTKQGEKAGVSFSGKRFHVVLVANIREHRAIRWQQVGDTAAALRLGEVGS